MTGRRGRRPSFAEAAHILGPELATQALVAGSEELLLDAAQAVNAEVEFRGWGWPDPIDAGRFLIQDAVGPLPDGGI